MGIIVNLLFTGSHRLPNEHPKNSTYPTFTYLLTQHEMRPER